MTARPRLLGALALAAVLTGASWSSPPAAEAHPFGDPQRVTVSASATGVDVRWQAAPDDVTALAAFLGVVGGAHVVVFEDGEYDPEQSSVPAGVRLAEEATVLSAYLLDQVRVQAAGEACTGELVPVDDVSDAGVEIAFDCGGPVATADVTVRVLTDLDPAYRTLAVGPGGQARAYSVDRDTFTWELPGVATGMPEAAPEAPAGRTAALQLGGTALAGVVIGAGVWGLRRRRAARVAG